MSSACFFDMLPGLAGTLEYPTGRGRSMMNHLVTLSRQLLTTDAVGTHALTLTNVVSGSRVHIESQDGATQHYDDIAPTGVITLDVYQSGSAKNDWRIRIRKASSGITYIPYETLMTAAKGSSSIYVNQVSDE